MKVRRLASALVLLLPLGLVACPGSDREDAPPSDPTMIVGIQSEDLGSAVGPVHIVAKLDGVVVRDETVQASPSSPLGGAPGAPNAQALPREIELKGQADGRVEVSVDAFAPGTNSNAVITRSVAAR